MRNRASRLAASALDMSLSPFMPANLATVIVARVGRDHPDHAWSFATASREASLRSADVLGRNRALAGVVAAANKVRHADMMEHDVGKHFGPDALVEAQRIGNGIRVRAAWKARLLPQPRPALQAPQQSR